MSEEYHKHTTYMRFVDFKRLDFIVQSLKKYSTKKDTWGLDLGCGRGNITVPLAYLGYNMMGIDISPENIRIAKSKQITRDNPLLFIGDAENLTLERADFDFVVCSEILEHLNHPEYALNSIREILKEKGVLIVTVPNGYGPYSLIYDRFRDLVISKIFDIPLTDHIQFFTLSKIKNLITEAGFDVLNVNHSDFISFLPIISKSKGISMLDCKLADKLPHRVVSGYYILCRKK